jgi:hypothetical protein
MSQRFLLLAAASLAALWTTQAAAQAPISSISSKMTVVATDLGQTETGKPVQAKQERIVRDLDDLIAALEKECAACKGGIKRNNPRRGLPDSVIRSGTGGIGNLVNPAQSQKDWAKLSDRERDRIIQSMSEGFPPEYRTVLERYYRRLAEEKTVPANGERSEAKDKDKQAPADKEKP